MNIKIATPAGNMYLSDDRMAEHALASFEDVTNYKEVEVQNLVEKESKTHYKIVTPFGTTYVRNYGDAFNMKCYYKRKQAKKDIDILDAY